MISVWVGDLSLLPYGQKMFFDIRLLPMFAWCQIFLMFDRLSVRKFISHPDEGTVEDDSHL
jgi:hypothetical protein